LFQLIRGCSSLNKVPVFLQQKCLIQLDPESRYQFPPLPGSRQHLQTPLSLFQRALCAFAWMSHQASSTSQDCPQQESTSGAPSGNAGAHGHQPCVVFRLRGIGDGLVARYRQSHGIASWAHLSCKSLCRIESSANKWHPLSATQWALSSHPSAVPAGGSQVVPFEPNRQSCAI
jgi:hypothetical protein